MTKYDTIDDHRNNARTCKMWETGILKSIHFNFNLDSSYFSVMQLFFNTQYDHFLTYNVRNVPFFSRNLEYRYVFFFLLL